MNVSGKFYTLCLPHKERRSGLGRFLNRILGALRRTILRVADPMCLIEVHGILLELPLSHPLPLYHAANPDCDRALSRVAAWLRSKGSTLTYIDVGANIGDTIAAIHPQSGDFIVAVEPFPAYASILRRNAMKFPSKFEIIEKICVGSKDFSGGMLVKGTAGTGVVTNDSEGTTPATTLDELFESIPSLTTCNFLKIDVDGFDFEVLRGADSLISHCRPVLLIEADVFADTNYLSEIMNLCAKLLSYGYRHLLAYDNYGGLIYSLNLGERDRLLPVLFYQVSRGRIYLDLLFGVDLSDLLKSEMLFFSNNSSTPARKAVSARIAQEISF
jgi:FkbM family methyltransferase